MKWWPWSRSTTSHALYNEPTLCTGGYRQIGVWYLVNWIIFVVKLPFFPNKTETVITILLQVKSSYFLNLNVIKTLVDPRGIPLFFSNTVLSPSFRSWIRHHNIFQKSRYQLLYIAHIVTLYLLFYKNDFSPMLFKCLTSVADVGPTFEPHWANVLC